MNQIIKQDCRSACPKFDYKTNPGKTECEWEIITKFIDEVILNIMEGTWLPGELDVIIFYALQQQQEIILIERNFLAGKQIN